MIGPPYKSASLRILILGLDNAGKSTVTAKWFDEDVNQVAPTVGFQIKTFVTSNGIRLDFWDIGGQASLRAFWSNYFHASDVLIWVVDSTDTFRLLEEERSEQICTASVRRELIDILSRPGLAGVEVLILANKQDLGTALKPSEVAAALGLEGEGRSRFHGHDVELVGCSAVASTPEELQQLLSGVLSRALTKMHLPTEEGLFQQLSERVECPRENANNTIAWDLDLIRQRINSSTFPSVVKPEWLDILP